MATFKITL